MGQAVAVRREVRDLLDEHEGLRPSLERLKRGCADADPDLASLAAIWRELWQGYLEAHCNLEEARLVIWLPGSPLLQRLHHDHGMLRRLTHALAGAPSLPTFQELIAHLEAHLAWERDELLPAVATAIGFDWQG